MSFLERLKSALSSREIYAITATVAVAVMVVAYMFPFPSTDTLCRYAPMAEAFASGNWVDAFHPRFAVGGSVVAGVFALLPGFDGFTACTVSASLAWALGVIPVFFIAARVFDRRTAWFAVVLYVLCPQPLIWALKGLREPFKMLGLLLMVDALLRVRDQTGTCRLALLEACVAQTFLCLFKCDAVVLAALTGLVFAVLDRFGKRTILLLAWCVAILQPMCLLVYQWTGYWLPTPHYALFLGKVFGG